MKHELCQMIKPLKDQEASEDQILISALLWELNSIDGGIFRCHLWAQFFWHGTSLSASLHSTKGQWFTYVQSLLRIIFVCMFVYIVTVLQMV